MGSSMLREATSYIRPVNIDNAHAFLKSVLDSVKDHIVVIDQYGEIKFYNKSWSCFGDENNCAASTWCGLNYLAECDNATRSGDEFGAKAGEGIRDVIAGNKAEFYFEYPCHSPCEQRWFMMRVTPFKMDRQCFYVISHQNITERKLAENEVFNLARLDGLTNILNRRTFDELLGSEWKRCSRSHTPISLALIDLDYFKLLNDYYGHQSGDDCLIRVGALLRSFANRTGDICARYGGEEFALVWPGTSLENAQHMAQNVVKQIAELKILNEHSPVNQYLTASIGVAQMIPTVEYDKADLINRADNMLYQAKKQGRNCVELSADQVPIHSVLRGHSGNNGIALA